MAWGTQDSTLKRGHVRRLTKLERSGLPPLQRYPPAFNKVFSGGNGGYTLARQQPSNPNAYVAMATVECPVNHKQGPALNCAITPASIIEGQHLTLT